MGHNIKISSTQFFTAWQSVVNLNKDELLRNWRDSKSYTSLIKGSENSIIRQVASKLNLLSYDVDYYSLDSVLYLPEDKVPDLNQNWFWFRDIRVAFEHENNFKAGLYQEVAHLLITNCDLKVLVSYPNDDSSDELNYLHKVITGNRGSDKIAEDESFLLIFGYESDFEWEGFVYKLDEWKRI